MDIPQDLIGNGEMGDLIHHALETPETEYITPNKNVTSEKQQSK